MSVPVFPKGARVVFAGDSITHANKYVCHIAEYYKSHLADRDVSFFNCGIAGCSLGTIISAFERDIVYYEPTHVVLTMGVNDSGKGVLDEGRDDKYDILLNRFTAFKNNLAVFSELCRAKNITLCLGTTFPYAEYQESNVPASPGGYALIQQYADAVRSFAVANGYEYCDFHPYLTREMMSNKLFCDDRVHPNDLGHFYIARCLLESQGFDLESDELSEGIEKWNDRVQAVRDVFVTMFRFDGFADSIPDLKKKVDAFLTSGRAGDGWLEVCMDGAAKRFLAVYKTFDEDVKWLKSFKP